MLIYVRNSTPHMETPSFDWDTPMEQGTVARVYNRLKTKHREEKVGSVTDPRLFLRGLWDLAYQQWWPDSVATSYSLAEMSECFVFLGKNKGVLCFQQVQQPSEKKYSFFANEGNAPKPTGRPRGTTQKKKPRKVS